MRRILDRVYDLSEWLAMASLCAIAALVFAQVAGRVVDRVIGLFGIAPYGFLVPSLAEIAGYLLVAASFLALAGSLRAGEQIRVSLVLARLPDSARRVIETIVLVLAAALAVFFFAYCVRMVLDSHRFNEVSYGIIPIQLWIPQAAMATGVGVFALALLDDLVTILRGGSASYMATGDGHAEEHL
ncbi:TRAP transporter small permease [Pseudohoeflea suaedae]|uniref:TRAP transporter small permease protein n=1 Tax=Pseudohoeflea suaedae TaxID=877384 RepID=A0A4R5PIC2_9HYPH|nr:TRAP transporter small permease [Pseudohoeflea suaedae]TDH34275.1 TRAP transporter small permease [Pseudohoeflea suaedae]